jgi:uracil-DNA glycosylase family 4
MIVGEAPGKDEVKLGRPFVGQSGKLLDSALHAVGIDRSTVFVTNVVKEIPLDDEGMIRRPNEEEIQNWLPILYGEIEQGSPAAILALGRTASQTLCNFPVKEAFIPFGSKVGYIYTAWHPAHVLYQGRSNMTEWLDQIRPWAEALHAA